MKKTGLTPTARLLRELIAIPSPNPAFAPATNTVSGEGKVADFLCSAARRTSLEVELQPVLPGRNNVLIRLIPQGRIAQRILLAPHLDTVGVNPPDESLLKPILKNGRLYGRGACDTKGSVAAMFTALCRTANSVDRPTQTEIIFAGLVDEENNQSGSRALVAAKLKGNQPPDSAADRQVDGPSGGRERVSHQQLVLITRDAWEDRGAARLQLRAQNIDALVVEMKKAGLKIASQGGVAIAIPPNLKGAVVADPNNFFLTPYAPCDGCAPGITAPARQ